MKNLIFYCSLVVLSVVPLYFIWNRVYRDGVIGRIALASVAFSAASTLVDIVIGQCPEKYELPHLGVLMVAGFAWFLVWHLVRFHFRVERRMHKGLPPDVEADRRRVPDRRFTAS